MNWDRYLETQNFNETVGITQGPKGKVRAKPGSIDWSVPHLQGVPATLTDRYHLPADAAPADGEAGFVDPSVLDEFAAAHDLSLEPATAADAQTIRYVSADGTNTFYTARLRPWLLSRPTNPPVTQPPVAPTTPVVVSPADLAPLLTAIEAQILAKLDAALEKALGPVLGRVVESLLPGLLAEILPAVFAAQKSVTAPVAAGNLETRLANLEIAVAKLSR